MSQQPAQVESPAPARSGADQLRHTLRFHSAGVSVITFESDTGPVGFTATSFASLSLEPPLISFNIANTSSSVEALRHADSIVVHLLRSHQIEVAQRFSRSAAERFADESLWTRLSSGEPLVEGATCWIRARVGETMEFGDHTLVIAEVADVHLDEVSSTTVGPLLYHEGAYHRSVPLQSR